MNPIIQRYLPFIAVLIFGLLGAVLFPAYQLQIAEMWLFVTFALAWDLTGGQMGYNSFGNVLFVGIGMYVAAVVQVGMYYDVGAYTTAKGGGTNFVFDATQFLTGLAVGIPAGALGSALVALALGSMVLGMRGHYFAICTLGLGIAAGELAAGWDWIGAGSGMTTPEPPASLGDTNILIYYLSFALALLTIVVFGWLLSTRFGIAINAIRDDEDKAEAMGHYTTRIKVTAWVIAAAFLGAAGAIFGNMKKFIDPSDTAFAGPTVGIWMILIALLGGRGTLWGPVIGAVIFQFTKELFWTYLLGWQRVALGLLIVVIVVFFTEGILGWARLRWPELFGHRVEEDKTHEAGEKVV